jgi:hypothetical protein
MLAQRLSDVGRTVAARLLAWSDRERAFLDRLLDHGEIAQELLTDDPAMQAAVREQPLLEWKALNVREFRRRGKSGGRAGRRPE